MKVVEIFNQSKLRSPVERIAHLDKPVPPPGYGYDYFDNPKYVGYGGYHYDGRYRGAAEKMCSQFGLSPGDKVLEVGCAKGFILYEFHCLGMDVTGLDASPYAVSVAKEEIRSRIAVHSSPELPFADNSFDFVLAKDMLPHLEAPGALKLISEIMRVGKSSFLEIQCADTDDSRDKMKRWDVTHVTIESENWWTDRLTELGYKGAYHCRVLF